MTKLYWIFVIVICAVSIWITEQAFSQTTIIILPDGNILRCIETPNGIITCV